MVVFIKFLLNNPKMKCNRAPDQHGTNVFKANNKILFVSPPATKSDSSSQIKQYKKIIFYLPTYPTHFSRVAGGETNNILLLAQQNQKFNFAEKILEATKLHVCCIHVRRIKEKGFSYLCMTSFYTFHIKNIVGKLYVNQITLYYLEVKASWSGLTSVCVSIYE